ncbi:sensor histidine kinase, partial [Streptomyces sp. NPDC057654]|uniref:sensor histidine kinase n=1 Tax=Streptomyces sp. NPDC057654 TaxID=3346196 RepID=UPI0036C70F0C
AVAVPMGTGKSARGVLLMARSADRTPFTPAESAPLLGFAGQAALAMELAERRRDAEQIALLEDRDRIARDLHDLAIQRLFATGMTLQSARRFVRHPEAVERLERSVDDLDATIKIIRSTIFGLRTHEGGPGQGGLRSRVTGAVSVAAATLGFAPAVRMEGPVDTVVPASVTEHAMAVLGEALSNVARHAEATAVEVRLVAGEGALTLTVTDDGTGIPDDASPASRSGLKNIEERAVALGGTSALDEPRGGGTRLRWRVPLPEAVTPPSE